MAFLVREGASEQARVACDCRGFEPLIIVVP